MNPSEKWARPQVVRDLDLAFPAHVDHLVPDYEQIPREFKQPNNPWCRFVSAWFFLGVRELLTEPREGVDEERALRHLQTVLGTFSIKHEHKEAAAAWLASRWFRCVVYETNERHDTPSQSGWAAWELAV